MCRIIIRFNVHLDIASVNFLNLQVDSTTHTLAKYLMEVGLPEYDMAYIPPSLLAAASLYLSLKLLTESSWSATLGYYSNYKEEELAPVVKSICKVVLKAESSKLQVSIETLTVEF